MARASFGFLGILVLVTATAAVAAESAPKFVTPAQYEPSRLLPVPPTADSAETMAELAELHKLEAARTKAQFDRANGDHENETASIFTEVLGPSFDLAKLPATTKMFADIRNDEKIAAAAAKEHFQRQRPWLVDASLSPCSKNEKPKTAYPSGHATMGYSFAVVLAAIVPEKSQAIFARAEEYAENRLVCGMHYRHDIVAGQVLGTVVAVEMMANPAFRAEMDAAAKELRAIHLARE